MKQLTKRLLSWASILEDQTRDQALMTAAMPFIFPHLALLPAAHLGKGATVGSVLPTLGAVMPAAVGVDIGCGMVAVRTHWTEDQVRSAPGGVGHLRHMIELEVPLSPGFYNIAVRPSAQPRVPELERMAARAGFDPDRYADNWRLQLGTLGGGNHFIEVTVDEQRRVGAFLHSGSRGIGNRIAQRHIKTAQELCTRWWIPLPDPDLAYLAEGTDEFWCSIRELRWAQHFALLQRDEMMDRVLDCLTRYVGEPVDEQERLNCHHNFTQQERHGGKQVWVSRKGAIEAKAGQPGLIPGSMGSASYVVTGRGNPLSLNSSPPGAGRAYSRTAARKAFTQADLRTAMRGIEYRDSAAFVDEIPQAYKPIDQVMADAADLVEVRHTLRQSLNVKGE